MTPIWPDLLGDDEVGAHLLGTRCTACGHVALGKRTTCAQCWRNDALAPAKLGRRGTIYSATVIHQGPPGFDGPYAVGYVDIEDGVRVFAHLAGAAAPGRAAKLAIGTVKTAADGTPLDGPIYRVE
jgi:uncharacterized OB-fold protein